MLGPKIIQQPLTKKDIAELAEEYFGDMIKVAVDIEEKSIAVGGPLHADGEKLLLKKGSEQKHIWGANYFPKRKKGERIEYSALINIRPRQDNRSQIIQSHEIKQAVKKIMEYYFGE